MKKCLMASTIGMVLLAAACVLASDYTLKRSKYTMVGTTTNVLNVLIPQSQANGAEVMEIQAVGGAGAETVTAARVSWDGFFTNTICVLSTPGPSSYNVASSNFVNITQASGVADVLRFSLTGTNTPVVEVVWKTHQADK